MRKQFVKSVRKHRSVPAAASCLRKTALAAAISLTASSALADAVSRSNIRLALDDVISSRPEVPVSEFDGRLAVESLIQSHPDPLYIALEERYEALPPFTHAQEEIPEQYIAEASTREQLADRLGTIAGNAARFVPKISTGIRHDDISERPAEEFDNEGQPLGRDYQTVIATINPTFQYEADKRKWAFKATYDYERGHYYVDRDSTINDHVVDLSYTLRMNRGDEILVTAIYEDTHDRTTKDPILDFDSGLEADELKYNRALTNFMYKSGGINNRSQYHVFYLAEKSDLVATRDRSGGYSLTKNGIGGSYLWQLRRKMALVGQLTYSDFDYDLRFRDNTHFRALVGTDMILGRRIRAKFRVGYEQKEFDVAVGDKAFGEPVWEGGLEWALRRKTSISLETGRNIFELVTIDGPIDTGKFNVQNWVRGAWSERWSDKLSTDVSYTYRNTDYIGREDGEEAQQLLLGAHYNLSDKLKLGFQGGFTRETTDLGSKVNRQTFTFRTDYSL